MRKYIVSAVLTLQAGARVGLSAAQAAARAHALKPLQFDKKLARGEYEVTAPVQFKVGEEIYTDAEVNKQLATFLESEDAARAKAKAKSEVPGKEIAALREKAAAWDKVQEELNALREFAADVQALPAELLEQVKAALKKSSEEKAGGK